MKNDEHANFVTLLNTLPTKDWQGVILHHSVTEDGDIIDMEGIKAFHKSYRIDGTSYRKDEFFKRKAEGKGMSFLEPWNDVGYHIFLEKINKQIFWELGRPFDQPGAHAVGYNDSHLGICAVGNFDQKDPFDTSVWE